MLRCVNVGVSYGAIRAVSGVSLHVAPGEVVCVLGANGAGKSSLLAGITGLMALSDGRLQFGGVDVTGWSGTRRVRAGLCLVPEGRELFGRLSVLDNLLLGAHHRYRRIGRAGFQAELDRVVALFPILGERLSQSAQTLSGGQQQALAIGRAMMAGPKVLMLDEPSTGLAPKLVAETFEKVVALAAEGVAVLVVEQNVKAALAVSQRGYVMDRGRIVLAGTREELQDNPRVQAAYLGGGQVAGNKETGR